MEIDFLDIKYVAMRKLKTHPTVLESYALKDSILSKVEYKGPPMMFMTCKNPSEIFNPTNDGYVNVEDHIIMNGNWPCRVVYPEQLITIREMSLPLYFVRVTSDSGKVEISGGNYLVPVCFYELEDYSSYSTRVIPDVSEIFTAEESFHINKSRRNYRMKLLSRRTGMGMDFNIFASEYFSMDMRTKATQVGTLGLYDFVTYSALFYDQVCADTYASALNTQLKLNGVIYHEL